MEDRRIVVMLNLFDQKHQCFVLENNTRLSTTIETDYEKLINTIFTLSNDYATLNVMLIGPKQYARGISKKIKEEELKKYNHNSLNITIPERIKK